jgi:phosphoribosyl 1,2-cyclic phosphodiesterase
MDVTFWGVRGSVPTPGKDTARYGGNTLCIELAFPGADRTVVLDAGSGIRLLGHDLIARPRPHGGNCIDLVLTHTHIDHILGLPYFQPLYRPQTRLTCYGPVTWPGVRLEQVIGDQFTYRYFPVRHTELAASITYVELKEGATDLGNGIVFKAAYLNHPLLCMGYRFEHDGRTLVTAFDTEPFCNLFSADPEDEGYDEMAAHLGQQAAEEAQERMRAFFAGADLLIHDGQFTRQEYLAGCKGWGHSPIEEAIEAAEAGNVRRLALVHHDPLRTDRELDAFSIRYGGVRAVSGLEVLFAREGLKLSL